MHGINRMAGFFAACLLSAASLKMTEISFSVSAIILPDLLKTQSKADSARRYAKARALIVQRYIAFHNQAAGILP